MEKELGLKGLDLTEALLIDRMFFDLNQKHIFDLAENNSLLLTRTADRIPDSCSYIEWNSGYHPQYVVSKTGKDESYKFRGSIFCLDLDYVEK